MVRAERFNQKVDRSGPIPDQHPEFGPCWIWTGDITKQGYGLFVFDGSRQSSHRSAWEQVAGPIGDPNLLACHTCDVRACVRNDEIGTYEVAGFLYRRIGHLWLGDQTANLADRDAKGRAPYQ